MPPLGIEPRIFPCREYEWNALPLGHKGNVIGCNRGAQDDHSKEENIRNQQGVAHHAVCIDSANSQTNLP